MAENEEGIIINLYKTFVARSQTTPLNHKKRCEIFAKIDSATIITVTYDFNFERVRKSKMCLQDI